MPTSSSKFFNLLRKLYGEIYYIFNLNGLFPKFLLIARKLRLTFISTEDFIPFYNL